MMHQRPNAWKYALWYTPFSVNAMLGDNISIYVTGQLYADSLRPTSQRTSKGPCRFWGSPLLTGWKLGQLRAKG